ncbi:copper amine oxidase N-terminal domain-containing protein [bacterium]|nr:MAG: copper amine oxidase N-terminal domain-containing protein [bacterium]
MSYDPSGNAFDFHGSSYVALTPNLRKLGGEVEWDNATKSATVTLNGKTATVRMAEESVTVDGVQQPLSGPSLVKDDVLYVPASFFRDVFGQSI